MKIINNLDQSAIQIEFQIIDKICAELSPEAAALMLDLARGMTSQGWDQSGGVMRARSNLERRLGGRGKTVIVEGSQEFQRLIADCCDTVTK